MPRTLSAVSVPSASQPAQYSSVIGWRLAWIRKLSSRDSVHFTGRSSSHAASAAWAWFDMSSLPPNAPPFDTSSTVTRDRSSCEHRGDVVAVVPHALATGVHVQRASSIARSPDGTASVDSGSRNACSMRCVRNVSCTVNALAASSAVDVARGRRRSTDSVFDVGAPHAQRRIVGERGDRVGVRAVHVVADRRPARPRRAPARAVSATTIASTSPAHEVRPPTGIITGQSLWISPTRSSPGMSAAVSTATTPSAASAAAASIDGDVGAGVVGEPQRGVEHAGHADVVDVPAVAERELGRLVLGAAPADLGRQRRACTCVPWATASIASSTFTYPVQRHRWAPRCGFIAVAGERRRPSCRSAPWRASRCRGCRTRTAARRTRRTHR